FAFVLDPQPADARTRTIAPRVRPRIGGFSVLGPAGYRGLLSREDRPRLRRGSARDERRHGSEHGVEPAPEALLALTLLRIGGDRLDQALQICRDGSQVLCNCISSIAHGSSLPRLAGRQTVTHTRTRLRLCGYSSVLSSSSRSRAPPCPRLDR